MQTRGNYTMPNTQCNTSVKLYNPKSHAPAAYIPCWLIQVSSEQLSFGAKLLYGRLAQWSNERGIVYRSAKQLCEEIGTNLRQVQRYIKELNDVCLISIYHPQAGGVNHYQFLDHPWMHDDINQNLVYKSDQDPPTNMSVPYDKSGGTLTTNPADINIKEIKRKTKPLKPIVDFGKAPKSTEYKDDELFMRFYNAYPNKQKPREAYREFLKVSAKVDKQDFVDMLIEDLAKRKANNWLTRDTHMIPHPRKYLHGHEWEGEIIRKEDKNNIKRKYLTFDEMLGANLCNM